MLPSLTLLSVLQKLSRLYRPPKTFLYFRTPLDLLVVTILSAQCTDKKVNEVSKMLFRKYQKAEDYVRVRRAELEEDIRSTGFYRTKARHIQELCHILLQKHSGKVPQTMEELTALPGVGRKTAAIILYAAFGKNEGIACDTHVIRLARRLGLTRNRAQDKIEKDLMQQVPRRQWGKVTTLLISHGRAICTAKDRQCHKCVFQKHCPSSIVLGRPDRAKGSL
jgi:endonuclease-3